MSHRDKQASLSEGLMRVWLGGCLNGIIIIIIIVGLEMIVAFCCVTFDRPGIDRLWTISSSRKQHSGFFLD